MPTAQQYSGETWWRAHLERVREEDAQIEVVHLGQEFEDYLEALLERPGDKRLRAGGALRDYAG